VLTAAALAENGAGDGTKRERRRAVVSAIAEASDYLGNTPAVARSAYVDPRVIDRFESGETIADWLPRLPHLDELSASGSKRRGRLRRTVEQAVIELINESGPSNGKANGTTNGRTNGKTTGRSSGKAKAAPNGTVKPKGKRAKAARAPKAGAA
jgi:hypothetical protein